MGRIPFWNPPFYRDFNSPFISSLQVQIFCSEHYSSFKKLHFPKEQRLKCTAF
jgi:hypothetical protein